MIQHSSPWPLSGLPPLIPPLLFFFPHIKNTHCFISLHIIRLHPVPLISNKENPLRLHLFYFSPSQLVSPSSLRGVRNWRTSLKGVGFVCISAKPLRHWYSPPGKRRERPGDGGRERGDPAGWVAVAVMHSISEMRGRGGGKGRVNVTFKCLFATLP